MTVAYKTPESYEICVNAIQEFIEQTQNIISTNINQSNFLTTAISFIKGLKNLNKKISKTGLELGFDVDTDTYIVFNEIIARLSGISTWSYEILNLLEIDNQSKNILNEAKDKIEKYKNEIRNCQQEIRAIRRSEEETLAAITHDVVSIQRAVLLYTQNDESYDEYNGEYNADELQFAFLQSLQKTITDALVKLKRELNEKEEFIQNLQEAYKRQITTQQTYYEDIMAKMKDSHANQLTAASDNSELIQKLESEKFEELRQTQQAFYNELQLLRIYMFEQYKDELSLESENYDKQLTLQGDTLESRQTEIRNHIKDIKNKYDEVIRHNYNMYRDQATELQSEFLNASQTYRSRIQDLEEILDEADKEIKNSEEAYKQSVFEINNLKNKIQEKTAQIINLSKNSSDENVKNVINNLAKENAILLAQQAECERSLNELKDQLAESIVRYNEKMGETNAYIQQLTEEYNKLLLNTKKSNQILDSKEVEHLSNIASNYSDTLRECDAEAAACLETSKQETQANINELTKMHDKKIEELAIAYNVKLQGIEETLKQVYNRKISEIKEKYDNEVLQCRNNRSEIMKPQPDSAEVARLQTSLQRQTEVYTQMTKEWNERETQLIEENNRLKNKILEESKMDTSNSDLTNDYQTMSVAEKGLHLDLLVDYISKLRNMLRREGMTYPEDIQKMVEKLVYDYIKLKNEIENERYITRSEITMLQNSLQLKSSECNQIKADVASNCNTSPDPPPSTLDKNKEIAIYIRQIAKYRSYIDDLKLFFGMNLSQNDSEVTQAIMQLSNEYRKLQFLYTSFEGDVQVVLKNLNRLFRIDITEDIHPRQQLLDFIQKLIYRETVYDTYISHLTRITENTQQNWLKFAALLPSENDTTEDLQAIKSQLTIFLEELKAQLASYENIKIASYDQDATAETIAQLNIKQTELQNNYNRLKRTYDDVIKDSQQKNTNVRDLETSLNSKLKDIQNLTENVRLKETEVASLVASNEEFQTQVEMLIAEIDAKNQTLDNVQSENTQLESQVQQIAKLNADIRKLRTDNQNLQTEIDNTNISLKSALEQLTESKAMNDTYQNNLESLQQQLATIQTTTSKEIESLNLELDRLSERLKVGMDAEKNIITANDTIQNHLRKISNLHNELEELDNQRQEATNEIYNLNQRLEQMVEEKNKYEDTIATLKRQNTNQNTQITQQTETIEQQNKRIAHLESEIAKHIQSITNLKTDVNKKNTLSYSHKKEISRYEEEVDDLKSQIKRFEESELEKNTQLNTLNLKIAEHAQTVAGLVEFEKSVLTQLNSLLTDISAMTSSNWTSSIKYNNPSVEIKAIVEILTTNINKLWMEKLNVLKKHQEITAQLQQAQTEITRLMDTDNTHQQEIQQLKSKLDEYINREIVLKREKAELNQKYDELATLGNTKTLVESEIQSLQDSTQELTTQIANFNTAIAQLKIEEQTLRQTNATKTNELQQLDEKIQQLTERYAELQTEFKNLQTSIQTATQEKNQLDTQLKNTRGEIKKIKQNISNRNDKKKRIQSLKHKYDVLSFTDKLQDLNNDKNDLSAYLQDLANDYGKLVTTYSQGLPPNQAPAFIEETDDKEKLEGINTGLYIVHQNYIQLKNLLEYKSRLYNELTEQAIINTREIENNREVINQATAQIQELKLQVANYIADINRLTNLTQNYETSITQTKKSIIPLIKYIRATFDRIASSSTGSSVETINKLYDDIINLKTIDTQAFENEMSEMLTKWDAKLKELNTQASSQSIPFENLKTHIQQLESQISQQIEECKALSTDDPIQQQTIQTTLNQYAYLKDILTTLLNLGQDKSEIKIDELHTYLKPLEKIYSAEIYGLGYQYQKVIQQVYPRSTIVEGSKLTVDSKQLNTITEAVETHVNTMKKIYDAIPKQYRKVNYQTFFQEVENLAATMKEFRLEELTTFPRTVRYFLTQFENASPDAPKIKYNNLTELFSKLEEVVKRSETQQKFYTQLIAENPNAKGILEQLPALYEKYNEMDTKHQAMIDFYNSYKPKMEVIQAFLLLGTVHSTHLARMLKHIYSHRPTALADIFDAFTMLVSKWMESNKNTYTQTFYDFIRTTPMNTINFGTYQYLTKEDDQKKLAESINRLRVNEKAQRQRQQSEQQRKPQGEPRSQSRQSQQRQPKNPKTTKPSLHATRENLAPTSKKTKTLAASTMTLPEK